MIRAFFPISIIVLAISGHGHAAEPATSAQRIISLAPSTTETLFALGLGDRIVGVTSFCDQPVAARAKPKIGGMSNPSLEAIVTLKPDLVVMTMDGNPKEVEERLRSMGIRTYVWKARTLAELPEGIRDLGRAVGATERSDRMARELRDSIERFKKKHAERPGKAQARKKVLLMIWPEPLIVAGPGTIMDDAVQLLGHENIAAGSKTQYPKYSLEEVIRQAPDVIFVGKASGMDMQAVSQGILKRLSSVPAMRTGSIFYISDSLYRLGPRVVSGIEELAACVQ
ncbi:MAG: hypothetical protein A2X56_09930 [Nitrospirae bacterium GWC2_57_13]|nr:MAG: hypothetical protein A2X56_09930 [Nitrospirae bacterium GWC2_57_13]OGW45000.1 MAG: hypothetical protein A2X57_02260 [Nitrospirae bacterium GWD2_57_8]HAR45448.1 hypothetical protein [Nitrospiraceae bacterium]